MKKILIFATAAIAVCPMFAETRRMSKAQMEKQGKTNWGNVEYFAGPAGENSIADDHEQIKSMAKAEIAKMKKLVDFGNSLLKNAPVSVEPEALLGDAMKQLSRPIDPTSARQLNSIQATPAQKLGIKSLLGAKDALARFDGNVRGKMAAFIKTIAEERLYSSYNRQMRVLSLEIIENGALIESFRKVDTAWGKYLGLLDKVARGTDKWKYFPVQLANPTIKRQLLAALLEESGLDCAFNADGKVHPKSSRTLHTLDNYFRRVTDSDIKQQENAIERCSAAYNEATNGMKAFREWFIENAMTLDPNPRSVLTEIYHTYADYIKQSFVLLKECKKATDDLRNETLPIGKLRKCRGFSPNKAFFTRSGQVSERPPAYVRRVNELALEAKRRFEEAVRRRIETAGRIQI
jgi:hypothetical protein